MSRLRAAVVTGVLAAGVSLAFTGTASAQDRDCPEFTFQEDAQAVLDQDTSDPNRLDDDGDGVACETLPSRGTAPGTGPGTGGTPAGDDSTNDEPSDTTDEGSSTGSDESDDSDNESSGSSTGSDSGVAPTGGVETGAGGTAAPGAAGGDQAELVALTLLGAGAIGGVAVFRRRAVTSSTR